MPSDIPAHLSRFATSEEAAHADAKLLQVWEMRLALEFYYPQNIEGDGFADGWMSCRYCQSRTRYHTHNGSVDVHEPTCLLVKHLRPGWPDSRPEDWTPAGRDLTVGGGSRNA